MRRSATNFEVARRCLGIALISMLAGCSSSAPQPTAQRRSAQRPRAPGAAQAGVSSTTENEKPAREIAAASAPAETLEPAAQDATPAAEQPESERKGRGPIYNEKADARADIQAALERAAYDNRRVLVKFGGNWCGWCFKLHDLFRENREIAALLRGEYELVLVDIKNNRDILNEYDPGGTHGYPWLTVLDASGKVLCNQDTGSLEDGRNHDPEKVKAFLEKWQPERVDAEQALAAGLERARVENKRVFLHIGAPWCGWCHVLDRFLREQRDLIGVDYIDLKIDQDRMTSGKELAARLRAGKAKGGIPWMAILDADGKTLMTSDGPKGNIGYPGEPHEIEYFVAMLHQTRQRLSDGQVGALERQLQDHAAKRKAAAH